MLRPFLLGRHPCVVRTKKARIRGLAPPIRAFSIQLSNQRLFEKSLQLKGG